MNAKVFFSRKNPILNWLNVLAENMFFAYSTIAVLQLKVMFFIWQYKGLNGGDASFYYRNALLWAQDLEVNFLRSPLYGIYLGTLIKLFNDAFWVEVAGRILVALIAALLLLCLFRRLMPKMLAWFIAAWWVLLPINFDTVYTVHLFSALFTFLIFVIVAYQPNKWGKGTAMGLFLLITVLVRNEYIVALILWGGFCGGYEIYNYIKEKKSPFYRYLASYGLPLFLSIVIIGLVYARSHYQYPQQQKLLEIKHTNNVCQIYAFNRIQQGDAWNGNPMSDCEEIMVRDFGKPSVSFSEAIIINPLAMIKHMWWNFKLIPSGTQLALFNHYSGGPNPDYVKTRTSKIVWIPFLIFIVIIISGVSIVIKNKVRRKDKWITDDILVWIAICCTVITSLTVMIVQRPRPSYMFNYTVFLMALFGLSLSINFRNTGNLYYYGKKFMPIGVILLILFAPPYYGADYADLNKGRKLKTDYRRITRYIDNIQNKKIIANSNVRHLCNYLGLKPNSGINYFKIMKQKPFNTSYPNYFNEFGVDFIYLDSMILQDPKSKKIIKGLLSNSWGYVVRSLEERNSWGLLLIRSKI